ncbi:hypothetical protein PG994_005140 [Apiospora phragmitis]|uniref:Uncharacterized protein n=1 Tax=Apiospora phragmitis TaxID=2905665 RepID=A0ABR1VV98_9PEZI
METRALVSERSEWKKHSFLRKDSPEIPGQEDFYLPGLEPHHLYHPLTLALFGLVDATCYLDRLIVTDGYSLGDIELMTKHGAWARKEEELKARRETEIGQIRRPGTASKQRQDCHRKDTKDQIEVNKAGQLEEAEASKKEVNRLSEASRRIATVIGVFSTLFKSVDVAKSIAETLENTDGWKEWLEKAVREEKDAPEHQEHTITQFNLVAESMRAAVQLLRARIHTVNESALSTQKRAKAQANVVSFRCLFTEHDLLYNTRLTKLQVSGLIAREDTRIGHTLADRARRDGSTMKVIALMTMAFLPATFFAALWSIPVLEDPGLTKDNFWVYWAFTVPTTIVIFFVWDWLNDKNLWKLTELETYHAAYRAFLGKFKKDNDTRARDVVKNPVIVNTAERSTDMLGGRESPPKETDLEKALGVDRRSAYSPYPANPSPQP